MVKIMFVCLGNICRSPMAKFIMKDIVTKKGLSDKIYIDSSATSTEEIGNDMYSPAKRKLSEKGIPYTYHEAKQFTRNDYTNFDLIICMESRNIISLNRIIESDYKNKVFRLLDFSNDKKDIADPWYTNDFEKCFNDIYHGCERLLKYIIKTKL